MDGKTGAQERRFGSPSAGWTTSTGCSARPNTRGTRMPPPPSSASTVSGVSPRKLNFFFFFFFFFFLFFFFFFLTFYSTVYSTYPSHRFSCFSTIMAPIPWGWPKAYQLPSGEAITGLTYSPSGSLAAVVTSGAVYVWKLTRGQGMGFFYMPVPQQSSPYFRAFFHFFFFFFSCTYFNGSDQAFTLPILLHLDSYLPLLLPRCCLPLSFPFSSLPHLVFYPGECVLVGQWKIDAPTLLSNAGESCLHLPSLVCIHNLCKIIYVYIYLYIYIYIYIYI